MLGIHIMMIVKIIHLMVMICPLVDQELLSSVLLKDLSLLPYFEIKAIRLVAHLHLLKMLLPVELYFYSQHDESDSPRTPKSRLGMQETTSSASLEDSALNLAEARAAFQGGLRKGNDRERFVPNKNNSDGLESRRRESLTNSSDSPRSTREYFAAPKAFSRSRQASDDEESARIASSSAPLSVLLIPSLKEDVADDSEGSAVHAVASSLVNMERIKPGSCDILVRSLLQRLASSKGIFTERSAGACSSPLEQGQDSLRRNPKCKYRS
ncbi:hypothetical protein OIU77_008962 [Salix suchowensis]|uniref:Uncharacterized protein n=1 Tax=Salix suchowensis TaxID=1278906 RepID=A0ABQ9ACP2_9ROSI|nr:hypothetical protein OIU77_008962 [Salix suchowensis]